MKFALRRSPDAPTPAEDPQVPDAPPKPTPPRGSPVSSYAGIVDGQTLWLAVEAVAGSLAFRASDGGDVVAVRSDLAEDQPAYRSVRVDLADLGGTGPASYDVVLVPPGGSPKPVWSPPLPDAEPLVVPPGRDGRTQYSLDRTPEGFLQVQRRPLEPATGLRHLGLRDGGIELVVDPVAGAEPTLLLLDTGSEVVASWPLEPTDAGWSAVVTLDRLPVGSGRTLRVGVGTADGWVPVRRPRNDLANPDGAVLLPQVFDDESDRPRLKARWTADARLQLRLPKSGPSGAGAEDDA